MSDLLGLSTFCKHPYLMSLTCVLCLLLLGPTAWAGPPFVTDDPETPDLHSFEINIPVTLEQSPTEREVQAPLFDINYGYTPNVQLTLQFPYPLLHHAVGEGAWGIGDTELGYKWRFQEETPTRPQIALYPQIILPTGNAQQELGAGRPSYILELAFQKSWGRWKAFASPGYSLQTAEGSRAFWFGGLGLVREVSNDLELGGEVFGQTAGEDGGRSQMAYSLGGTWRLSDQRAILLSGGRSFRGERESRFYLGVQITTKGAERGTPAAEARRVASRSQGEPTNGPQSCAAGETQTAER